jgi:NAD-dependent dihydropyrimidine dehydrogenase PreA subunit
LAGKGVLIAILLATPVIMASFVGAGYGSGNTLSLLNRDVQLAREAADDEAGRVSRPSDPLKVFKASGDAPADLYARVATIQKHFRIGGALVGAWMGLIVSGKLIAHSVRRRRSEYTADSGTCVGCARCFKQCPVELKRRGLITELPVVSVR